MDHEVTFLFLKKRVVSESLSSSPII